MNNYKSGINFRLVYNFEKIVALKRILQYRITKKPYFFPTSFQIQTKRACNGRCIMCPISLDNIDKKIGEMSDKTFDKIAEEIAEKGPRFTFVYLFLQNEPLTDKKIFKRIQKLKELTDNKIFTNLVTNGTLFNDEKIKELEKSGLDILHISIDAFSEKTYNHIRKGLNYKTLMENIDRIIESDYDGGLSVGFVAQKENINEVNDFRKYWNKRCIYPYISQVNNRSGDLSKFENIEYSTPPSFFNKLRHNMHITMSNNCHMIYTIFNVLYDGSVILCCNDYSQKIILGNINDESIVEIWNSSKYQEIRNHIYRREFNKVPPCKDCTMILKY